MSIYPEFSLFFFKVKLDRIQDNSMRLSWVNPGRRQMSSKEKFCTGTDVALFSSQLLYFLPKQKFSV